MAIFYSASTRGFYDSEIGYTSLPEDIIEITREEHANYVKSINTENKDISVINGAIVLIDRPAAITWKTIRLMRQGKLRKSDYTQMPDYPGDKQAWAEYRQALRDLPQTYATPADVIWPTPPGENT